MNRTAAGIGLLVVVALVLAPGPTASAAAGNSTLWTQRYNGIASKIDYANSLAVSPDGSNVFVTGASWGSGSRYDYATVAYDAAGGVQWAQRYDGPASSYDNANSLAASPDGSKVFVTGYSIGSVTDYDYATIAYDAATGSVLWGKRYSAPGNRDDIADSVAVSPDGSKVFVTGQSRGLGTSLDYATIAYDAATGGVLWGKRYNGPGNSYDRPFSLAVSPGGSEVLVTGESIGSGTDYDYATIAYDAATGGVLWGKRYNGPGNSSDSGSSVAVTPDGSKVIVTGSTGFFSDYATIAYDAASGGALWTKRYDGPGGSYDVPLSLAVSPDGSKAFVTGRSTGAGTDYDYATIAYDTATGGALWTKRYDGPGTDTDYAYSVGVSPDGSQAFVTGVSNGSGTFSDYATIAYDAATGGVLWTQRYDGPGNGGDGACCLAVSPDGSMVFITGGSAGSGTFEDYGTIAYSTS
jgi:DNA-binding beta-propeller fold protein YncE